MSDSVVDDIISFVVLAASLFIIAAGVWFAFSGYHQLSDGLGHREWISYEQSKQCLSHSMMDDHTVYLFQGLSMRPSLWPGDYVWSYPYNSSIGFVEGDVVAVNSSIGLVVHRVRSVTSNGLVLQGDNNKQPDLERYGLDQVVGVVCFVQKPMKQ